MDNLTLAQLVISILAGIGSSFLVVIGAALWVNTSIRVLQTQMDTVIALLDRKVDKEVCDERFAKKFQA
jgi:hypothetical protein